MTAGNVGDGGKTTVAATDTCDHGFPMKIILVTLDRATERRQQMAVEFNRAGLHYDVLPAVDARTLTHRQRTFADQERRRRVGLHPISDGSLANTLSHRAAIEGFLESGPDVMAVFEDDARFDAALPGVLAALAATPSAFDIVKLQRRNFRRPFIPSIGLSTGHWLGRVRFADYGSEGFVITREAAKRLLERTPRMFRDFDHALSYFWENGLNVFYVDPPVVWEDQTSSSLIDETRSKERLAHRRVRRRQPAVLARHIAFTVLRDFKRRTAFRRLLRSDRSTFASTSTSSVPFDTAPPPAAGSANDPLSEHRPRTSAPHRRSE